MPTNNVGQSDIVTFQTNIWNKVYSVKRIFHYIVFRFSQTHKKNLKDFKYVLIFSLVLVACEFSNFVIFRLQNISGIHAATWRQKLAVNDSTWYTKGSYTHENVMWDCNDSQPDLRINRNYIHTKSSNRLDPLWAESSWTLERGCGLT